MTVSAFQKAILAFYSKNRRNFPWRETQDAYEIMVSELMLQQTQTQRVIPKYLTWLQLFPTVSALSEATLEQVLTAWNGLGYNRRAKFLWHAAQEVQRKNNGIVPNTADELRQLPGIGEYTANAILAFAFNQPTIVLETNIRTAILHHFFKDSVEKVSDKQIKDMLGQVIDKKNPRDWYYALMDYGSWLKSEGVDYFHKQKSYTKQKPFKGSERFVRGYLIRETLKLKTLNIKAVKIPGYEQKQIVKVASDLIKEGLLQEQKPGTVSVV